ncbi:MAG: hypothetical protein NC080_07355 [Paraprevotella sp.]|nr:hypothetical protein [Paraprevotella sp.]
MATKRQAATPLTGLDDPFNVSDNSYVQNPIGTAQQAVPNAWDVILPKVKAASLPDTDKQAADSLYSDLRWLEAKDKIQERLAKNMPPPTIPLWETIKGRIAGFDDLPYVEQKRLYDTYIEDAKAVFSAWNDNQPKKKRLDDITIDETFRKYNPEPVKPERQWGDLLNDMKLGVQSGAASLMGTAATLIDTLAGTPKENSKYWEDLVEAYDKEKSAYTKDQRKLAAFRLSQLYADPEKSALGRFLGEAGIAVKTLTVDQAISLAMQMLPSVAAGAATAGLGTMAGLGAQAAGRLALGAGTVLNSALSAGDAASTARDLALNLTESQIKSTPEGLRLWEQTGGDIGAVREELAKDAASGGAILGGIIGAVGAMVPGSAERALSAGLKGTRGLLASTATGALLGATEEAATGIAGRAAGNRTGANANVLEGAGSDFALGLLGEAGGAAAGHVGGTLLRSPQQRAENALANAETVTATIEAIKQATANKANAAVDTATAPKDGDSSPAADVTAADVKAVTQDLNQLQSQQTALDEAQQTQTAAQQAVEQTQAQPDLVDLMQAPVEQVVEQAPAPVSAPTQQTAIEQTQAPLPLELNPPTTRTVVPLMHDIDLPEELAKQNLTSNGNTIRFDNAFEKLALQALYGNQDAIAFANSIGINNEQLRLAGIDVKDRVANTLPVNNEIHVTDPRITGESSTEGQLPVIDTENPTVTQRYPGESWAAAVQRGDGEGTLRAMLMDNDLPASVKNMAGAILDAYNKAGIEIPRLTYQEVINNEKGKPDPSIAGAYQPLTHEVQISNKGDPRTAGHEFIHGFSYRGLLALEEAAVNGDKTARDSLAYAQAVIEKIRAALPESYGRFNIMEAIAELSNPDFVRSLSQLPLGDLPPEASYLTIRKKDGESISLKGEVNPGKEFVESRPSILKALVKAIKRIIDFVAPGNRLTEKTLLDSVLDLANYSATETANRFYDVPRQPIADAPDLTTDEAAPQQNTPKEEALPVGQIPDGVDLPRNIPRTGLKHEGKSLAFENDLDRSAFMLGRNTKYKQAYTDFIKDHTGFTDAQIEDYTDLITQRVKQTPVKGDRRWVPSISSAPVLRRFDSTTSGELSAYLISGSELDILMESAKDQELAPPVQSVQQTIEETVNKTPAAPATLSRDVVQAVKSKNMSRVKSALSRALDIMGEKFADSLLPVKRWTDDILAMNDNLQPQVTEFLGTMYGIQNIRDYHLEQLNSNGQQKFLERMAAVVKKTGLSEETASRIVGNYLSAKWAPTANQRLIKRQEKEVRDSWKALNAEPENQNLRSKYEADFDLLQQRIEAVNNPDINKNEHTVGLAGGMTNAQAAALQQACIEAIGKENLESVAEAVYDMNAWRLTLDVESGKAAPEVVAEFLGKPDIVDDLKQLSKVSLMPTDSADALREKVRKLVRTEYVPLSGNPDAAIDGDAFGPSRGPRRGPNLKADMRMEGRIFMPDNGINTTFASCLKSATFAGTRPFQEATANLYAAMSSDEREAAGFGRTTYDRIDAFPAGAIIYRAGNGKTYAFEVAGELFDALRKANTEEAASILQFISKPTQWFAYAATQLNPTFAPINFFRDVWERSDLIRARDLQGGNAAKASRNIWRYAFNPQVWRAAFKYAAGKKLGFNFAETALDDLLRTGNISTRTDYFAGSKGKQIEAIAKAGSKLNTAQSKVRKVVEMYNRTFDLIAPLSSYLAMRNAGASKAVASATTLDLMNFRKTGTVMPAVKALYAFAQPAVTSGVNMLSSLKNKDGSLNWRTVGRLTGYIAAALLFQSTARAIAGSDEGGDKLRQLSEWTRTNSLNFPIGDSVVSLPLGFGLPRIANAIAQSMLDYTSNEQTLTEAFGSAVRSSVVPAISPIEPVGADWNQYPVKSLLLSFSPTWMRGMVEVGVNMTADGRPISRREWLKKDVFASEQGGMTTAELYKLGASELRKISGVDLTPEELGHLIKSFTPGGFGALRTMMIDNPNRESLGRDATNPFTGRFVRQFSDSAAIQQFYRYDERIGLIRKQATAGEELSKEEQDLLRLGEQWKEIDKDFRSRSSAITKKIASEETKKRMRLALIQQKQEVMKRFVKRFRMAEGKTVG